MGCRNHRLRGKSGGPTISGRKIKFSLKSAKSADNAVEYELLTPDSDSSDEEDGPWPVRDIIVASQIVKCSPVGKHTSPRQPYLEKNYQRTEFRLPKLQFVDIMVSIEQVKVCNLAFLVPFFISLNLQ